MKYVKVTLAIIYFNSILKCIDLCVLKEVLTMYLDRELNMQNIETFTIFLFERNRGQIQDVIIQKQIILKHIS